MKTHLFVSLFCLGALLSIAPTAYGHPTFAQTPPGDLSSFWTSPNSWDNVSFTVTASKSDSHGILSWGLNPLPDGANVTGAPSSGGPYDEVAWDFSWTPTHDHQGTIVLAFRATDGNGDGFHQVTIDVEPKDLPTGGTDYVGIYSDLESTLVDFQTYLDSDDPAVSQDLPAVPLKWGLTILGTESVACNRFLVWNVDHYEPNSYYLEKMKVQVDKIVELGADVIKMNIGYPLFIDAFNTWSSSTVLEWEYSDIGCIDIHYSPMRWGDRASGAAGEPTEWEHGVDIAWTKEDFIVFFKELVDYIRGKGKKISMSHNSIKWQYTNVDSLAYFDWMKEAEGWDPASIRARYRQERAEEFAFLCKELRPDYALVIMEAEVQNKDFGDLEPPGGPFHDTPLFLNSYLPPSHPDYDLCWGSYVDAAIAAFKAIPGGPPPTELGVCMGTWEHDETADSLIDAYSLHDDIDYIDWHLYPAKGISDEGTPEQVTIDCLKNLVEWTNRVRSINPDARVVVGECWLQKAKATDFAADPPPSHALIFGRDSYSFWAPLDQLYLRLIRDACKRKNIELLMPFWGPRYFYDYLAYDELPTDYGAPYWNPPDGYNLQDIENKCAGLAIQVYYKDPNYSTWWSDPTTGRLPESKLSLTGETFVALSTEEICNNGIDDDHDGQIDFEYDLDCDAVVGWLSGDGSLVVRGSGIYRDLPDRLPISGTSVELSFGRYIDDHRSWRLITRSVDRAGLIVSRLELEIEGDFSLTGEVDFELLIYSDGVGTYISGMQGYCVDLEKYSNGEQTIYKVNSGVLEVHGTFLAGGEWIVLEYGQIIDGGSVHSGEYPPVPGGCTDADLDGFAVDGGDCGEVDCDDDPASCGTACHPWHAEFHGDEFDNDCDGYSDEPCYGDLGPFSEGDGLLCAADFRLSIDTVRSTLFLVGEETALIDVAPIRICDESADPIQIAPNPDNKLDSSDLSVLLQANLGFVELVPFCR